MSMRRCKLFVAAASVAVGVSQARSADLKATYLFNHNTFAEELGAPYLQEVAPQVEGYYRTATVFGASRTVYHFGGDTSPELQGGLTVATNQILSGGSYSLEMVLSLETRDGAYRRLADTSDRQSDAGLYYDPSNKLDLYSGTAGSTVVDASQFHHVGLTVSPADNVVKGYVDGNLEFTTSAYAMQLSQPNQIISFFLDNQAGGGQGEYSAGSVALSRLWEGVLSDSEMAGLGSNPFGAVPEPSGAIVLGGVAFMSMTRRRS